MILAGTADVHGTDLVAIVSLIVVAAVELACGFSVGGDTLIYLERPVAGFLAIAALLFVWSDVRSEHGQRLGGTL
jgi:hypothetical protein